MTKGQMYTVDKKTVRSDEWSVGRVGSENQKRKSMKTGRQWWTVNKLERIWRQQGQLLTVTSSVIRYYGDTTCQDVSINQLKKGFCYLLWWPCDSWAQMQKGQKWNVKVVGAQYSNPLVENVIVCLPLGCVSRTEQPAGACETRSFPPQLQVSNFYSTKRAITAHLAFVSHLVSLMFSKQQLEVGWNKGTGKKEALKRYFDGIVTCCCPTGTNNHGWAHILRVLIPEKPRWHQ